MTTQHENGPTAEIELEIESLRSEIGGLVDELDRRRHEATDVRLQIRRHPRAAALLLGVVALSVIGRLVLLRRRRATRLSTRAANLARALALLSREDPDRVRRAVEGRHNPTALGALAKAGVSLLPRIGPLASR